MSEQIRGAMQRFYDEVIGEGKTDLIDELCTEDFVDHEEFPGLGNDRESVKQFVGIFREAFSDLRIEVDAMFTDGDTAIARMRTLGTHTGEFMGIPATNAQIEVPSVDIARFTGDGRVAEHWGVTDNLAMMQQLGVVPEEPPAA